jgi:hypothetical protein
MDMAKTPKRSDGVYYGTRKLPGGGFGIWVLTFKGGALETENLNKCPWPTQEVALDRALRSAKVEAENEGLTVVGQIWDGRVPSAA